MFYIKWNFAIEDSQVSVDRSVAKANWTELIKIVNE